MKWEKPAASDMRFGFEITMYIASQPAGATRRAASVIPPFSDPTSDPPLGRFRPVC